ncbi:MAG: DUF302 domain-containing protein [Gammaproteobacteria bacterium]|nr:DUF302 domain-containing protein [Gammaproteobacteria bacterium]MDH3534603.1 DUF302 domain-containing protein [Gammaproteobacteria bacterium]
MRKFILALALAGLIGPALAAGEGMISVKSAHSVAATADRLEKILASKGMKVFIRIDHAAGAASIGKELRPTELVIFGNPKVGTPLMQCSHSIAIDLPQKALIWEDPAGQVWFSYNDPQFLALRHDTRGCDAVLDKVATALGNFARAASAAE